MRSLRGVSGQYFSFLHNLISLTLVKVMIEHIGKEDFDTCFSAFRGTLTNLNLELFTTSFSAFVTLIDYFPNISTLQLGSLVLKPDKGPVPPLSRPLRGKLRIYCAAENYLAFFDQLARLDQRYEELVIDPGDPIAVGTRFLENVLQFSTGTIRYFRLFGELEREYSLHILSPLHNLTQPFTS